MTLREVIRHVDETKPNAFENIDKVDFLNDIETMILDEVLKHPHERPYSYTTEQDNDLDKELLVPAPYDVLYRYWLAAQIDLADGEFDYYQNSAAVYNAVFEKFCCWVGNNWDPAKGGEPEWLIRWLEENG